MVQWSFSSIQCKDRMLPFCRTMQFLKNEEEWESVSLRTFVTLYTSLTYST